MQLDSEQRSRLDRDGYLFFPSLFKPDEIAVLLKEVPPLYAEHRPENVREKGSDAVRTNFAAHLYSAPFARLARHPRMVLPIMQIFDEPGDECRDLSRRRQRVQWPADVHSRQSQARRDRSRA